MPITEAQRSELRAIFDSLDAVESVRLAGWAYDTLSVSLDLDDEGRGLMAKYMRALARWSEMPPRSDVQRVRLALVYAVKGRLPALAEVFTVKQPKAEPPPEPDPDMVLDATYQAWLAGEAKRMVEELEARAQKAAAEAATLEAQARAMREAATPRPSPTAWETSVASALFDKTPTPSAVDTEQAAEEQEGRTTP